MKQVGKIFFLWKNIKWPNINIIGIPEEEEKETNEIWRYYAREFSKILLIGAKPQIQESHRITTGINTKHIYKFLNISCSNFWNQWWTERDYIQRNKDKN